MSDRCAFVRDNVFHLQVVALPLLSALRLLRLVTLPSIQHRHVGGSQLRPDVLTNDAKGVCSSGALSLCTWSEQY